MHLICELLYFFRKKKKKRLKSSHLTSVLFLGCFRLIWLSSTLYKKSVSVRVFQPVEWVCWMPKGNIFLKMTFFYSLILSVSFMWTHRVQPRYTFYEHHFTDNLCSIDFWCWAIHYFLSSKNIKTYFIHIHL